MEKEFNLSEKISSDVDSYDMIHKEKVKEFIRLQEKLVELIINKKITHKEFVKRWCKLAGDELN